MTRCSRALALLGIGIAVSWPTLVVAQSVRGTVLESVQGSPIPGTFVVLLDEEGTERGRALTTQAGTYRIGVPGPGSYRLKVRRIGLADVTTDLFIVGDGEAVSRQIRVSLAPVRLTDLEVMVETESKCGMLQEDALALYSVWEEARKALEATFWTGQQTYYRFDALLSRRDLDRGGIQIGETELESIRVYGRHPFRSARADDLAHGGWVRPTGAGGVKFHAPDAEVLLSESFSSRHCYRLQREIIDGHKHIGVQFEPLPGRRLPDISGVLWIDLETAELRTLDFRYEVLNVPFNTDQLGGHVEFDRLPDGAWIVRRWIIRTPVTQFTGTRSFSGRRSGANIRLVGLYEEGQEVTAVWRTGDLQAGPGNEQPEDVPPVNAPTDRLIIRFPVGD
ncbi:MAG: carboxypeptidase regulatory-like domain-containing protein [Gemmatimonadales bacterium]|nr:MAG: carboxypeptidase regulatory-like domain-containing protein [Gemmatimonadales bacterium]